jgi:glycosyltransferase involved in cell wall biosynthesis
VLKILLIHNIYQQSGGEDIVFESEKTLLLEEGHKVSTFIVDNDSIRGIKNKLITALSVSYSQAAKRKLAKVLLEYNPDIVHAHNIFPLLSPSIYDACIEMKVPIVQTLHNYRIICPGALLMRNRQICEKCITGSAYQAVLHKCYKNSVLGSLAVARMVENHRKQGTWENKVDKFIALTVFAKNKFIEAGLPENKIVVKPNFTHDSFLKNSVTTKRRCEALFVGRISPEKGVDTLLNAWRKLDIPLKIVGPGKINNSVEVGSNIQVLGELDKKSVEIEMENSSFLVMPSEWYEGFPMVIVEAFSRGLPIICSRLGGMSEIVSDGATGLHFEAGNVLDLISKVRWMAGHRKECYQMGVNARNEYESKYTPEINYETLIDIYQQVIEEYSPRAEKEGLS